MKSYTVTLFASIVALSFSSPSKADTHVENPDAGISEATAQVLPRRTTHITGTINAGSTDAFGANPLDVDVFCFTLDQPVAGASITVISPDGGFDPNLLLLRQGFFGIAGDDDSGGGINDLDSRIVMNLDPGTYYIALGNNNIGAFPAGANDSGDIAWNDDSGILDPGEASVPIAFVGAQDAEVLAAQTYVVVFNFATADDPVTAAMRKSLERKIKKLKKKIKRAKGADDTPLLQKLKKKLKRFKKKLRRL